MGKENVVNTAFMNHSKIYNAIIQRALNRKVEGYTESHHILPRCLGGTDDPSNLVNLTAREHYIVHLLLTRIYPEGEVHYKLVYTVLMMGHPNVVTKHKPNSYQYEAVRKQYSKAVSDRNKRRVLDGTNPFAGEKGSEHAKKLAAKALAEGTCKLATFTKEERSAVTKAFWSTMTAEERSAYIKAMIWDNCSPEDIERRKNNLREINRNHYKLKHQYKLDHMVRINLLPR